VELFFKNTIKNGFSKRQNGNSGHKKTLHLKVEGFFYDKNYLFTID
jgi:hypothetical protein